MKQMQICSRKRFDDYYGIDGRTFRVVTIIEVKKRGYEWEVTLGFRANGVKIIGEQTYRTSNRIVLSMDYSADYLLHETDRCAYLIPKSDTLLSDITDDWAKERTQIAVQSVKR